MHKCRCGFDHTEKEELFEGTSKSAEGHSTKEAFVQAKEEGMQIEIHWQDADSSSAKAIQDIMPQTKTMKCLGHMGWVHNNQLEALTRKKKKTAFFNQHKGKFPSVGTVKCVCANKNHNFIARPYKPACGCISDAFRRKARINHWCTANQCENDLQKYAETLRALGQYHVHDKYISGWVPVSPLTKCKYGKCEEELKCQGTPYSTQSPLTCPLHALAYKIEMHKRADDTENVIHREMGWGHSNLNEANHCYRSKDVALTGSIIPLVLTMASFSLICHGLLKNMVKNTTGF